jgi:tetratricopeptide (TPR) repeat protein
MTRFRQVLALAALLCVWAVGAASLHAQAANSPQELAASHQRAQQLVQSRQYQSALEVYQKILAAEPQDVRALYNSACLYSLLNDPPKALEFLKKAVDAGWSDVAHIESDPDLESLRGETAYQELVKRLKTAARTTPPVRTPNFAEDAKRILVKPLSGNAVNNPAAQKAWKQISESSEKVLKNIYETCGLALPPSKRVEVYFKDQPGKSRPGQIVYAVTYPASFGSYMEVSLPTLLRNNYNYMHIYQHEVVHAIQQSIMGNAAYWSNVLHEWIREGLATYVGGHGPERVAKFGRGGNTSFINGLENHSVPADYAEGYLAFLYIEKKWGRAGVISFVQDITYKRTPWKQAIKNLTGMDWPAFQADVRSFSIAHVKEKTAAEPIAQKPPTLAPDPAKPQSAPANPPLGGSVAQTNPPAPSVKPAAAPTFANATPSAAGAKPYFGAQIQDLDAETAQTYNLKNGVIVTAVRSGTPADSAGFDAGDVILKFNGITARNVTQLNSIIAASKPGSTVPVEVSREGSPLILNVTIGTQP